jgi:hypothetical protein
LGVVFVYYAIVTTCVKYGVKLDVVCYNDVIWFSVFGTSVVGFNKSCYNPSVNFVTRIIYNIKRNSGAIPPFFYINTNFFLLHCYKPKKRPFSHTHTDLFSPRHAHTCAVSHTHTRIYCYRLRAYAWVYNKQYCATWPFCGGVVYNGLWLAKSSRRVLSVACGVYCQAVTVVACGYFRVSKKAVLLRPSLLA